jgi:threonine dehydrogenase-like Zn-dependent dehydrogenase
LNLEDADEASFFTIYISPVKYLSVVEQIARKLVDVRGLITHRFKLDEFESALRVADNPADKPVKVIIVQ